MPQSPNQAKYYSYFCLPDIADQTKEDRLLTRLANKSLSKYISDVDYAWLKSQKLTNDITDGAFFKKRADREILIWLRGRKNPWCLINAISDLRKAKQHERALALIKRNYPFKFCANNKKALSVLLTVSGAVKRDVGNYKGAIKLGHEALNASESTFKPHTLLGACYILSGEIDKGFDYYRKAVLLGFKPNNAEIDSVLRHVTKAQKTTLIEILKK